VSAAGEFTELARVGGRGALVTRLETGDKILIRMDGARVGSLGDLALDEQAAQLADELMWAERSERRGELFVDVTFPPPRLFVFGAVDFVVDPRARFAQAARFPDAEEVVAAWPEEAFHRLGGIDRATAIAVLTHDPKLDDAALVLALRSDAGYIGAMGSRRAQAKRRERLVAKGIEESDLERVSAPIGLDLGALTAEETALSIIGEIVAMRHGRDGGRLAHAQGRIHEVGV
jgi:xanthine dehydrogenase accessory factor